jgi:hypothetical protein
MVQNPMQCIRFTEWVMMPTPSYSRFDCNMRRGIGSFFGIDKNEANSHSFAICCCSHWHRSKQREHIYTLLLFRWTPSAIVAMIHQPNQVVTFKRAKDQTSLAFSIQRGGHHEAGHLTVIRGFLGSFWHCLDW